MLPAKFELTFGHNHKLASVVPGAFYHVITRGNNRQKLFVADEDYQFFLDRLNFYKERFKFVLYAYVLMSNHVHMLLETGDAPLSRIMQSLQFTYAQKFNWRHKKVGHLFQGGYKAILCQKENYLLELIRYIALNPFRAYLVKKPMDWRWSSYYDLINLKDNHIVSFDEVLGLFDKSRKPAVRALQEHINNGLKEGHNELYYKLKDQRVLGDDDFAHEVIKEGDVDVDDFKYYNIQIKDVVAIVAGQLGIGKERIMSVTRERIGVKARGLVVYICKTMCGKTANDVVKYFGRSEPVMSDTMKRIELELVEEKSEIGKMTRGIIATIKKNHRPGIVREVKIT